MTLPRQAVLGLITGSSEHLTADQVRHQLSLRGIDLPRSSINNILGKLARNGLIGRTETLPGPVRFEAEPGEHDHYWCSRCGLTTNLPSRPREAAPPLPGSVTNETTVYMGECDACAARRSEEARLDQPNVDNNRKDHRE